MKVKYSFLLFFTNFHLFDHSTNLGLFNKYIILAHPYANFYFTKSVLILFILPHLKGSTNFYCLVILLCFFFGGGVIISCHINL